MKVRIAENVLLVSALAPGQDLTWGQEIEVPELTARDWIRRGWALEIGSASPPRGPAKREVK